MGDILNERKARELAPLAKGDPDAAREVYEAVKAERGDKLTATDLKQTRIFRRRQGKESPF
jgi:hypothetical protein